MSLVPLWLQLSSAFPQGQVGDLSSYNTKYSSPALIQKVFANKRRVGKGCSGVETPLFEGMIVAQQVGKRVAEVNVEDVPAIDVTNEGAASINDDEVPAAIDEPSIPSPISSNQPPPTTQDIPYTSQVQPTPPPSPLTLPPSPQQQPQPSQDADISMDLLHNLLDTCATLNRRVKKLERRNKLKVLKLRRLKKVGTAQRIETSDDTVMDYVSKQGRIIIDMDADKDVTLKDVAVVAKDVQDTEIEESLDIQGRQAESQALIYQIDLEHADKVLSMHDVDIEPVKLQEVVEVVTTAKLITKVVTAASATITAGVVIRNPKETATPSIIIHSEAKSKDKGKGILDEVIDHVQRKAKEDNVVKRYQALKRKPQTEAQARKNMMIYLRNKTKEQMEEENNRALKRISESQKDKAAKKQKLDEEVAELKRHLQIVPNNEDDVYTEATPLARKVPVVDYEIYTENNKPYYKIIRADGSPQLFLSFLSLLRNFDREDLEKPDVQAQVWKNQRTVHGLAKVKSWRLLESCRVHIITFTSTQMILLVERRYPLTRFTLDQMLNNVRLEVEEESQVSLERLRFIRQKQEKGFRPE
nr:hypothetical protein [Tanacetum cinerariifolium]